MMASEPKLEVRTNEVGPWPMNTYVLTCPNTAQSVLIDPGAEPDTLQEMLADSTPIAILLTHTHQDHFFALEEMYARLGVPLMAHTNAHLDGMGLNVDRQLDMGDLVQVGDYNLRVYYAPGHIDDQICFYLDGDARAIVGDTIFEGGPGKTWSAAGFKTTLQTLQNVILPWPDDTICYPGHGPSFRLGDNREEIERFLKKDHGDFFGDATWDM